MSQYKVTAPHPIDLGGPGDFVEADPADVEELVAIGHLTAAATSRTPQTSTTETASKATPKLDPSKEK